MNRQLRKIVSLARGGALQEGKLPDASGVYFFTGHRGKTLYIGRATSLRSRVRSYFDAKISDKRSPWIAKMLTEARSVEYRETQSVLEAILLEANLIKKFKPPYNTDLKDDKSFNCVLITDEDFPRVLVIRQKDIDFSSLKLKSRRPKTSSPKPLTIYGPFPRGSELKIALGIIRKIFPYRDQRCKPATSLIHPSKRGEGNGSGHPCFSRQIGLCPGVCTGEIGKQEYAKTIRNIRFLFEGKTEKLLRALKKEMKTAARSLRFEDAQKIKKTIFALKHIQDVALVTRPGAEWSAGPRIEGYDLSHFGGKEIVGAMSVVRGGIAHSFEYRLFRLRSIKSQNEAAGLHEILERRFRHPEWPLPQLVVVDGNEVQKRVAEALIRKLGLHIPVVAVVKDERHRPWEVLGFETAFGQGVPKQDILLVNAEAHRFALSFQRKRSLSSHLNHYTL